MSNEATNQKTAEDAQRPIHKRLVMFLWHGIGMPGMWLLLMLALVVDELITGSTLVGGFWVVVCLFAYFLSRIAWAVEKIAESNSGT